MSLPQLNQQFRQDAVRIVQVECDSVSTHRVQHQQRGHKPNLGGVDDASISSQIVTRALLDRLPTFHDLESNVSATTSNAQHQPIVCVCERCGSILHPGYQGTSLTVQRTKRATASMRRRRLRQQKQARLREQRTIKGFRNNRRPDRTPPTNAPAIVVAVLREDPAHCWALERHHLKLACGSCAHKIRLIGLKRQQAPVVAASAPQKRKTAAVAAVSESSEFVALPPVAQPNAALTVDAVKKRKKKKKKLQGGKLMSFLSKLND